MKGLCSRPERSELSTTRSRSHTRIMDTATDTAPNHPVIDEGGDVTWKYTHSQTGEVSKHCFPAGSWGAALLDPNATAYTSQGVEANCGLLKLCETNEKIWNINGPLSVGRDLRWGSRELYSSMFTVKPSRSATESESTTGDQSEFGVRIKLKVLRDPTRDKFVSLVQSPDHESSDTFRRYEEQADFCSLEGAVSFALTDRPNLLESAFSDGKMTDVLSGQATLGGHPANTCCVELRCIETPLPGELVCDGENPASRKSRSCTMVVKGSV